MDIFGAPLEPEQTALNVNFNDEQRAAVFSGIEGAKVVMAGAGCGKTSGVILPRAEYLLTQDPGSKALILAYNNKIKEELEHKVKTIVSKQVNRNITTKTSHATALSLVMAHKELLNLPKTTKLIDAEWKITAFLKNEMKEDKYNYNPLFHKEFTGLGDEQISALLQVEEILHNVESDPSKVIGMFRVLKQVTIATSLSFIEWAYDKRMVKGQLMFRDLLPLAAKLPDHCFAALSYTHLLVDEAQDLSVDQHALVEKLSKHAKSLMFVGDTAQCIYRFSGSRPDLLLDISDRYPGIESFPLTVNYRCSQAILDLANHMLDKFIQSPIRIQAPEDKPCEPIKVMFIESSMESVVNSSDTATTPEEAAAELNLLYDEPINWVHETVASGAKLEDMAILYRCNADSIGLELELLKASIPYKCTSGSSFEHPVIEDIMAYVRMLTKGSTKDQEDWSRIVKHMKYLGKETAAQSWDESLGNPIGAGQPPEACRTSRQKALYYEMINVCRRIEDLLKRDLISGVDAIVAHLEDQYWTKKWANDPEKIRDAIDLAQAFRKWAKSLCKTSLDLVDIVQKVRDWVSNNPKESLALSTIHKAKGLEWEHVAIYRMGGRIPLGHPYADQVEEMCIAYVAFTRAKKTLTLMVSIEPKWLPYRMEEMLCELGYLAPNKGVYKTCDNCNFQLQCVSARQAV